MKRILALILITTVVFSLGIVIARRIGGAQPPSSFDLIFTNPDGTPCQMPCMFGIRVGETTGEQADALLQKHPLTRKSTDSLDQSRAAISQTQITIFVAVLEEGKVIGIEISHPLRLTLGDAVLRLKQPDGIIFEENSTDGHFFYDADNIRIFFDRNLMCGGNGICIDNRVGIETPITVMRMWRSASMAKSPIRKWLGFASMNRYFTPTP